MFSQDRNTLRQFLATSWRKYLAQQPLNALESQLVEIIAQHPEYHALLTATEKHGTEIAEDQSSVDNPFLHLALHQAIREQLTTNRPTGIVEIHRKLCQKLNDTHAAEHSLMEVLAETMWRIIQKKQEFSEAEYLENLKRLLT